MVNFIIITDDYPNYSKKIIDSGNIPIDIVNICSVIKEVFCLSYTIRKQNNMLLLFMTPRVVIKFVGAKLKYLGPDLRSQSLLLLKSLKKHRNSAIHEEFRWIESTPGIYSSHLNFEELFNILQIDEVKKNLIIAINEDLIEIGNSFQNYIISNLNFLDPETLNIFIVRGNSNLQEAPLFLLKNKDKVTSKIVIVSDLVLKFNFYNDNSIKSS